jgi:hypothetical protein
MARPKRKIEIDPKRDFDFELTNPSLKIRIHVVWPHKTATREDGLRYWVFVYNKNGVKNGVCNLDKDMVPYFRNENNMIKYGFDERLDEVRDILTVHRVQYGY